MAWLLYGATNYDIADWDIGVSLLMGLGAYALAPWSIYIFGSAVRFRPKYWWLHAALAVLAGWMVVDGSYVIYHTARGNMMFRDANARASACLYLLCGMIWLYRGSLGQLWTDIYRAFSSSSR